MSEHKIVLKPCPFCGGHAELDAQRGFLAFPNGKCETQAAIYCAGDVPCLADMSICYSDQPDTHPDDVVQQVADAWNTRADTALQSENERLRAQVESYEVIGYMSEPSARNIINGNDVIVGKASDIRTVAVYVLKQKEGK